MRIFLDDIRNPINYGYENMVWVKTAQEAIDCLKTGNVLFLSLDHDLTPDQQNLGGTYGQVFEDGLPSGYDVVLWLKEHPEFWPKGLQVHSHNPAGAGRIQKVIEQVSKYVMKYVPFGTASGPKRLICRFYEPTVKK